MRYLHHIAYALLFLPLCADAAEYLELKRFYLIDGTGAAAREVERLVIRDGKVVAIDGQGEVPELEPGARWTSIDADGAWVMPGLIDTHVHVARFPETRRHAERILRSAVRGGVTGVRDLGGDARALADIERAMGAGEFVGPELLFSVMLGGPDIYRGGPTSMLASGRSPGAAAWARVATAETDWRLAIAEAKGAGVGNIKLYGDMDAGTARTIIAEAQRQQLQTSAHATIFPGRPGDLVEAGIGSLSHAPYLVWEAADSVPADYRARIAGPWASIPPDHPRLLALYERMAERGVLLDATLWIYKAMNSFSPHVQADWADEAFAWAAQATRLAHQVGVKITAGTDWFEPQNDWGLPNTHQELAVLVDAAGFTPMEAVVAGTRNGALAMGLGDSHGTLEVGKLADLLVLDASPLDDIRNTTRIRMTIRQGVVIDARRR
jgi:imidazolonepropionase-like amidohydrolase